MEVPGLIEPTVNLHLKPKPEDASPPPLSSSPLSILSVFLSDSAFLRMGWEKKEKRKQKNQNKTPLAEILNLFGES